MPTVSVQLDSAFYDIRIETGGLRRLGTLVTETAPHERAVLAVDENIRSTHGASARTSLEEAGYEIVEIGLRATEREKTLESVRVMYDRMLEANLDRTTPVIAVGGGIVGDTAGFAAATFLRGLPLIQVPTTLLAMVDASVGGKTGVNIPLPPREDSNRQPEDADRSARGLGKNLIGAFWQPKLVLTDPQTLTTLEEREYRCGLAECAKHGMIASPEHLTFIASHAAEIKERDAASVERLITESVSIKAAIVAEDERESGVRALLNLGHTFAHAIESCPELDMRHGEAVAVGLCAATLVSALTQRVSEQEAKSLIDLIKLLELPTRLTGPVEIDRLMAAMQFDKKIRAGRLRLVLPVGIGSAEVFDDIDEQIIRKAWAGVIG